MNSAFDRNTQQNDAGNKLVVAFEKMSEVLRVLLWEKATTHKLSPIQIQILIFLKNHEDALARPAALASEFNVTRPTVSDAIKSLKSKELIIAHTDPNDSRSRILSLTQEGLALTEELESFPSPLQEKIAELSADEQSAILERMITLLDSLATAGVISKQRMCYSCAHYQGDKKEVHHCLFLKKNLNTSELRIDCPEHEAA